MPFPFAAALPVLGNALGGLFEHSSQGGNIGAVADFAAEAGAVNPFGFQGSAGGLQFQDGQGIFTGSPQQQAIMQALQGQALGGLQGQGLQSQFFQQAGLGASPEFMQQQAALGQGFQPDFDVQGFVDQKLARLREGAQPFEDRAGQQLANRQFSTGQLGTTGGGLQTEAFARGLGQADIQRQELAEGLGIQLQNQLFGQGLQTQQQNLSQGQQRLGNMLQLFGLGSGAIGQDIASSQGLLGIGQGQQGLENQLFLGSLGADAARMGAQADVLGAQVGLLGPQGAQAAQGGGIISGIAKGVGGLFSDARLKVDVELYKTINGINFYTFHWAPHARGIAKDMTGSDVGVIAQELQQQYPELVVQDDRSGYLMVDYAAVGEVIRNG
jgi:hypothetical protein